MYSGQNFLSIILTDGVGDKGEWGKDSRWIVLTAH